MTISRSSLPATVSPLCCLILAAMLGACASTAPVPPAPAPAPAPAAIKPSADQLALADGIALYNKGQFNDAIKRLAAAEVGAGNKASQTMALKYSAFSYCVTGRTTLCRQQFEKAFKLDPAFDLAQGEHGHPLWGPAFARARKAR